MADDPLAPYGPDQPLTSGESLLLQALRAEPDAASLVDAWLAANVTFTTGADDELFLRTGGSDPVHLELLVRRHLLPLAARLHGMGQGPHASSIAALAVRLALATLGVEHPTTLTSLGNLAVCLESNGRAAEALPLHELAREASERVLGLEHPDTLIGLNNLAGCLARLGQPRQAVLLYERAAESSERVLGAGHPHTLKFLENLAAQLNSLGLFAEALPVLRRTLAVREGVLGAEHQDTLDNLRDLIVCLGRLSRWSEAVPLSEHEVERRRRVLGPEHPKTTDSLDRQALCLQGCGLQARALPMLEEVLVVRERLLGAEHPDTLTGLANLASCLHSLGHLSRAQSLFERALQTSERVLGADDPGTLSTMHMLATCLDSQGLSSRALPLFERALAARERVLGAEHRDTLASLRNLAICLDSIGLKAKALPMAERVVEACDRVLGPEHVQTLASVETLADCLRSHGFHSRALPLYERVASARELALGPEHPDTLSSIAHLARCLDSLGLASQALPLFERALKGSESVLGIDHPRTFACIGHLAECLESIGLATKALPLHRRGIDASTRVLGGEHPHTLTRITNLAVCLASLGLSSQALPLFQRMLELRERVDGPEHPDTLACVANLALCLSSRGQASAALPLFRRALAASERVLGAEHPQTLVGVNNLADCLRLLGSASEALPLCERALEAGERVWGPEHPATRRNLNNLAVCLESLGLAARALPLYERALASGQQSPDAGDLLYLTSVHNLAGCLESLGQHQAVVVRRRELAAGLLLRPLPGGRWMELVSEASAAIASLARAGRLADWDALFAALSTALRQVTDLESPEQLEASRESARRFFAIHLGLCIDQGRVDLIPQVLAARQGRRLAALVLDELESRAETLDGGMPAARLQALRVELRRLALGLRDGDELPGGSFATAADRTRLAADTLNERQRAQSEAYRMRLQEYQALREEVARGNPDLVVPARALDVSMTDLQARLEPGEALLLLFERDDPPARLALLVTRDAARLVPLVDDALAQAGALSAHWGRTSYSRAGMRRGAVPQSELAADAGDEDGARAADTPVGRLGALLQAGLWAPLAAQLAGVRRLHVVTHGSFHLLPLDCAAPDGLELCGYPGFVYYHRLRHQPADAPAPLAAGGLLGLAVDAAHATPGVPPIPFVAAEARIVRALWPGGVQAEPDIAQAAPSLAALQLAGHGQVDPKDPARAGLLAGGGMLDLHAVLAARQRPAVVVLSACTVGRTTDDRDGEPLGLVGGFMLRGARVVIASLQPVPDFYMPLLMALFHRGWRDGATPAAALADAKRRLAQGRWHADTEGLVREAYRPVLLDSLAGALLPPHDGDPLPGLTHAWTFPPRYRELHPARDRERLAELRALLVPQDGRQRVAEAVLQTLVDERDRLPRRAVDTLCTWVMAFGAPP